MGKGITKKHKALKVILIVLAVMVVLCIGGFFIAATHTQIIVGFLQKMAYTIQTVILFGGLALVNYNSQITSATKDINSTTKGAIGFICFGAPAILMLLSLLVFSKKFKLHGELAEKVHDYIVEHRQNIQ